MKNINKFTFLALALTLISTMALAQQEESSLQNIERKKMESLWFSNTDNAAGAQLDQMDYYSQLGINYNSTKGDFKHTQLGKHNTSYGFSTDGGGEMKNLKGMFLWGYFDYSHEKERDASFNASLIDPLRGTPFYIADQNLSDWINQSYKLGMKGATPVLGDHWIIGLGMDYENAQGAKQMDPRPNVLMSKFTVTPSLVFKANKHAIGANFQYYSRREDGTASNSVSMKTQPVWEVVAPGFYDAGEIGGGALSGLRDYNANSLGGGLQYSFAGENLSLLLSAKYAFAVEDVNNNYTQPKKIGTTKENMWDFSANLKWQLNKNNAMFAKANYYDRSIDGIEYVQVWDNSHEVAKWVILSKNIRSNFSTKQVNFNLDYMNFGNDNAYSWLAGLDVNYEKLEEIYYLPTSEQQVENLYVKANVKKNFSFGENMILVSANGGVKNNLGGSRNYTGNHAETLIYTDMVLRDYHFLLNNAYSLGGEVSYTRKGIIGDNSSLFVSATIDYTKATSCPKDYTFGNRTFVVVKAGLTF
ncbi:MAG: hypothetical protein II299_02335 [Alistipes sp.]|nr:hypothetical protein [Alistipes sp.]